MKKSTAVIIILCLLFSMSSCGKTTNDSNYAKGTPVPSETESNGKEGLNEGDELPINTENQQSPEAPLVTQTIQPQTTSEVTPKATETHSIEATTAPEKTAMPEDTDEEETETLIETFAPTPTTASTEKPTPAATALPTDNVKDTASPLLTDKPSEQRETAGPTAPQTAEPTEKPANTHGSIDLPFIPII